jgi:hypothetical protein
MDGAGLLGTQIIGSYRHRIKAKKKESLDILEYLSLSQERRCIKWRGNVTGPDTRFWKWRPVALKERSAKALISRYGRDHAFNTQHSREMFRAEERE